MLDLVFYTGDQFPPEYKGSAFVALKGSWNRSEPTGYKVVRVPFRNGRPEGYYENFATGFWASGNQRAEVWGRPAALAVAKDGSLLVADDTGGTIWRISYTSRSETTGSTEKRRIELAGAWVSRPGGEGQVLGKRARFAFGDRSRPPRYMSFDRLSRKLCRVMDTATLMQVFRHGDSATTDR